MSQKGKFESFAIEFGKENKQNTKYGNVYNIEKKEGNQIKMEIFKIIYARK